MGDEPLEWIPGQRIGPYVFGAPVGGLSLKWCETKELDFYDEPEVVYEDGIGLEVIAYDGRITTVNCVPAILYKGHRLDEMNVSDIGHMLAESPRVSGPFDGYADGWMSYWFSEAMIAVVTEADGTLLHFDVWGA